MTDNSLEKEKITPSPTIALAEPPLGFTSNYMTLESKDGEEAAVTPK